MAIALLTGGHILLEGLPGTAKTRAVKSLANALNIDYSRIQFTPDLLPSDITGTNMYDKDSEQFHFQKGPIFSSIVLADEVNRAPAKVQAALLEAMAEQTVTFAGESYQLPEPFMVLATQNPIEQEGTYPLPEAQMDRFAMKVEVSYPSRETEIDIIKLVRQEALLGNSVKAKQSTSNTLNLIAEGKQEVKEVYCADSIDCYIADLVIATRETERYPNSQLKEWIEVGVSPRASLSLDSCSRANAWLDGRDYVTPDDVRSVAHSVLCHRIRPTFTAHASGVTTHKIIDELLNVVPLT
jgi:MoxR-like ATPase